MRVAAIGGLARLRADRQIRSCSSCGVERSQAALRLAQSGASRSGGLESEGRFGVAREGLSRSRPGDHTIAADALDLSLATPGAKARELAALYAKHGQPPALRSTAIGAFGRLAKDDPHVGAIRSSSFATTLIATVRFRAWMMVRQLKLKKALPVLEARLGRDHLGFAGFARDMLEATIKELKEEGSKPPSNEPAPAQAKTIAELEKQVGELERKASELTSQIAELKQKGDQADRASKSTTGSATNSDGSR